MNAAQNGLEDDWTANCLPIPAPNFCHGAGHQPMIGPAETGITGHSQKLPADLGIDQPVVDLIRDGVAPSTSRAYTSDLAKFRAWGGTVPASPSAIARFVAELSNTHKVASISRMLAALAKAHTAAGLNNPCRSELVLATMRGIRRRLGMIQRQARPLLRDDLFELLDHLGERPKDVRDRAVLLLGWATAMRRSELASLHVEDLEFSGRGIMVTLRRSKTDQEGRGRQIAVPFGKTRHCPVRALEGWLRLAEISSGPLFLSLNKHGHILPEPISGEAVSFMLKSRLTAAGYDPALFSGHSLRAGFVTAAAQAGAPSHKIRQTTGHRSEASLARYIRAVDLFDDPAIAKLL
ncbi:site-specific integrase [Devosia sp. A369]